MLAKSTQLRHPLGITFETPLLVPSFSSKGFGFNKENVSEASEALKFSIQFLTDSMLISAYDIFHKHLPKTEEFQTATEIIFLDSGGYETVEEHDLSAVFRHQCPIKEWNDKDYQSIIHEWPKHIPTVFVSFDHGSIRMPVKDQIDAARGFFSAYPAQMSDLILKPETKTQRYLQIPSILGLIDELADFNIIGLTEKELGNSMLNRMVNIAKIRRALDEAKIIVPIHVFGSLDPVTSCLYFLAGAEIFDGLTWLRYSYKDGTAIYQQNYGALFIGIHIRDNDMKCKIIVDNIYALQNLRYEMKDFLLNRDFSKFTNHSELLKKCYDTLCSQLGGNI